MRIVHVVQCLGMGGQERLILHLSRELLRRGHTVSVISLTAGGSLRSEFDGIPICDVVRNPRFDPGVIARMAFTLRKLKPDVVHTHNPSPMFYAVPAARMLAIRAVHTKHGANIYGRRGLVSARVVVRMLSALVAVSEPTAQIARTKERVPERLLHVIPNGIPLSDYGPNESARARIRAELGIAADAFVVGSVGRLAPEKDYPLLVRAMTPLLRNGVRLVLVGDGDAKQSVVAAIEERVLPFVTLTGARRDVPSLLAAMDVFALSSRTEGLPLVIPEAMATGLPIVATAVGGLPSVVPENVGTLVSYGDAAKMSAAFEAMRDDPARRKAMGHAARDMALAKFSIEAMTDRYERLYQG